MDRYADHFRTPDAGTTYDARIFERGTWDAHVGALEMRWMRQAVVRRFGQTRPVHLDFACGTGRVLVALAGVVGEAHGYDTSSSMLEVAREKDVPAALHLILPTGPLPSRPALEGRPVLVTAFRFLLNADEPARDRALTFAAAALAEAGRDGLVALNNHGNQLSFRELARLRRRHRGPWFNSLSHRQMLAMLTRHHLRPVAWRGFGLFPSILYRHSWTAEMARWTNDGMARLALLSRMSIDVVYLATLMGGR